MTLIQPIFLLLLFAVALVYLVRLRSTLMERVVVLLLAAIACTLIADPELSSLIAHRIGIGRGVDLIIYLSFYGVAFLLVLLFGKNRQLETQITELTRAIALTTAKTPDDAASH